jgi:type I restriction enzyme M protein
LKYIDDLEDEIKFKSELKNKKYEKLFKKDFQWKNWAYKENARENLNGEDLIDFVQNKLFPYLSSFKNDKHDIGTLHYKIGEIFSEITNKITDGYILRDILYISNELRFKTEDEKFQFTNLYESKLKQMGNAGRNGGQYYTPRPLIDSIVDIIDPKPGE